MRYSLEQLSLFDQVARSGSFSATARQIGKTQPAVSTAICNLEIDLGVTLFLRNARHLQLTDAGQKLLEETRIILEHCQELEQRAYSIMQGIETKISIAIGIPYAIIAPVLKEFAYTFPYVDVHIKEPFLGDVAGMIMQGDADLGIAFTQPVDPHRCRFVQLGKLVMVHVANCNHPLARLAQVTFLDLHRWRQIILSSHEKRIATTEYLHPPTLWKAESYSAILQAALAGLGWASLPRQFVKRELEEGKLVELIQKEYPYTDWLVGVDLLWSADHARGKAAEWLRRRLIEFKIFEQDAAGHDTTL
ncbi:MAG: LysR family transcriptional regulator [Enterobacteriaceae bacterium]